ncbi:hypothetical protein SD81_016125 [Tolypothrix campylonemoides VB511288]|nr:hypothetical protein SD81_016125 [Tolypothrix campylonemoides VB511288]
MHRHLDDDIARRASLDARLDALEAKLPGMIDTLGEGDFYAAFRREADVVRRDMRAEDFPHVSRRIQDMLARSGMIVGDQPVDHAWPPKPELDAPGTD